MFTRTQPPLDFATLLREQAQLNKRLEDRLSQPLDAVEKLSRPHAAAAPPPPAARGWHVPPPTVIEPVTFDPDTWPTRKLEPPRFDGANVTSWIARVQHYYDYCLTPLADRLYLTQFLLDDAAAEWFNYWEAIHSDKTWDSFLVDAKLRFDPDLYDDSVGRLATLRHTGSLDEYLADFEQVLSKVDHVSDSTLTSFFIAGLQPSLRADLLTRRPTSLCAAMALARHLVTSQSTRSSTPPPPRHTDVRTSSATQKYTPLHARPVDRSRTHTSTYRAPRDGQPRDYPIVRISATEQKVNTKKKALDELNLVSQEALNQHEFNVPLAKEEPKVDEVVEKKVEEATPPPPPATEEPSETVLKKVEEKVEAVEESWISPLLTQRTKCKFVFAAPTKAIAALFKYTSPEQVPVQYGGLSNEGDTGSEMGETPTSTSKKKTTQAADLEMHLRVAQANEKK